MPRKIKTKRLEVARKRKATRPKRLQAQRHQPLEHRAPSLRDPRVRAELRREAKLLAKHPENDAIDAWIEAVYDSSDWK